VCICHGYDTGEIGCDGSGGNPGGYNPGGNPNPSPTGNPSGLYLGSSSKRCIPFTSLVVLLSFCMLNNMFGFV